jgi:hypothetical protein
MTRFDTLRKPLVNDPVAPEVHKRPDATVPACLRGAVILFLAGGAQLRFARLVGFLANIAARLLIVPAVFFIHRRNGEVAEWSKALPC